MALDDITLLLMTSQCFNLPHMVLDDLSQGIDYLKSF